MGGCDLQIRLCLVLAMKKTLVLNSKLLRGFCVALLGSGIPATLTMLSLLLYSSAAVGQTQGVEVVAKIAQAVTVRIEGATQGSGVLMEREGNRYTVLTAWHVVSGQRPGEELDVYTPDGRRYAVEQGSIKKLGVVDMAVLTFSSSSLYELARVGDVNSLSIGSEIYVSGFPLPSSAVPVRSMRFLEGKIIANMQDSIPNGYQLLYSNAGITLPGMSGGPVLNGLGLLVGIRGQAEADYKLTEQSGVAVKTGTNQGIPVVLYLNHVGKGKSVSSRSPVGGMQASSAATQADVAVSSRSCQFLSPVGGDGVTYIVTKIIGPGNPLPFSRASQESDFLVARPYGFYKIFFTANSSMSISYPIQGFLKFADGSSRQVINESYSPQAGTGRQWVVEAVPGKIAAYIGFKIGSYPGREAAGFTYRVAAQGCN
jgi:S1-C subfamily serine protease